MKVIFFHDHIITKKGDTLYSTGGLNSKVIARYLKLCKSFTIGSRSDSSRKIEKLSKISDLEDISFIPIPNLASFNLFSLIKAFKLIYKSIDENDFVIIRLPSLIGLMAVLITRIKRKKYLIEVVGCAWDSYFNYSLKGRFIALPLYLIIRYFVKRCNNVIYVTNKFLQKRYPSNAKNQTGCSDVEVIIDKKVINSRLIHNSKQIKNIIKIGMIGSLDAKYKGYDTAIKALDILKRKGELNFILELVGGGNSNYVNKLISKHNLENEIRIIGTLPHPKGIFNWLDSIDIYLQPSRQEGLPRALVEAMSRGCACIGSNVGGIPELLMPEYIHKKSDFHKLSLLISDLFNFEKRKKNSINSFEKASNYNKKSLDAKRLHFYVKSLQN
jgi:glycosyltransferase involved in cell wall biosynthesis